MFDFASFFSMVLKFSTIFIFGAVGETIVQKSGHLNMGAPGIMYLGALGGIVGERIYLNCFPTDVAASALNPFLIVFIPVIFAMLFAGVGGLVSSFFTVTLKCNQNVTGLTMTTFGVGISCYFIGTMDMTNMSKAGLKMQSMFSGWENLGWFGEIFLSQSAFTYLAIIVAILAALFLKKSRIGLNLRAVGENPAAADAASINVNRYRYLATIIGSMITGIGGAFFELDKAKGMFNVADAIDGFGWLALCLVIFSFWRPIVAIFTSLFFAALLTLPYFLSFPGHGYMTYIMQMLPYVITIVILVINSIGNKKSTQPPEGLGVSYFKEDR